MISEIQQSRFGTAASRWAGVGPYYAMFPVSFATAAVKEYTKPGDCVFDPFAGRATSLFAAASEGRIGLGIEINPVGWVYGKAKLQTANRESVEQRVRWLGKMAQHYRVDARRLPRFFHSCFCPEVRRFLLAARASLDWRRKKTDWTTMALLMVDRWGIYCLTPVPDSTLMWSHYASNHQGSGGIGIRSIVYRGLKAN